MLSASAELSDADIREFIARWKKSGGAERANYQLFITELCDLLGVERPEPATDYDLHNAYTFDRVVTHTRPDGTTTTNYIDCYKRGHFILETKQGVKKKAEQSTSGAVAGVGRKKQGHGVRGTTRYDMAMRAAYNQADRYSRALPISEGIPPFLLVIDIGHSIEVYSEFSRSGKTYVPFPDPHSFRISINDLAQSDVREQLRLVFTDPMALDPSRNAAKVTREVARHLAELSRSLEEQGYEPERTAHFLMRCIFTMFAEDVELIPKDGFRNLLMEFTLHTPADKRLSAKTFPEMVRDIWRAMDTGQFSVNLKQKLQQFNGGLFAATEVLPLNENQITLLYNAAACQWRGVEPAIFGTLLERALNPAERHKLGAHYTPRAYVERLVLPTVIEPLRDDWESVLTAAVVLDGEGKWKQAVKTCREFLHGLTQKLVLDPACGTGNFLYVTLDHMKRLEGEVRDAMASFTGSHQAEIESSEFQVDPHQFLGIEVNPRAAAIAELVLWIGYLQWQIKALGTTRLPEPVLKAYHNIECRDAVLSYTTTRPRLDANGEPVTRWDGVTKKSHPVTGELVPDETARVPVLDYMDPEKAVWPMTHFVVGNPPFLGTARMRAALGDGYAEALRAAYPDVPESADFVMYWWHKAAEYLRAAPSESTGQVIALVEPPDQEGIVHYPHEFLRRKHLPVGTQVPILDRFGFITTNSLRQTFNRRVLQYHMTASEEPISLIFAIPDHPWVESADGAAVRIAMTVARRGKAPGVLQVVESEASSDDARINETGPETPEMTFNIQSGIIHPDLTVGANTTSVQNLLSNKGLAIKGFELGSQGFLIDQIMLTKWVRVDPNLKKILHPYMNGKDLTKGVSSRYVIDLFGYSAEAAREFGLAFQHLSGKVQAERTVNREKRTAEKWWLFRRSGQELRLALVNLEQYIATTRTSKHRVFQFLPSNVRSESKIVIIASESALILGILSSRIHVIFSTKVGGWLGVGNDPTYNHITCFETFPFPTSTPEQAARIREIAERLDAHRKRQQALHPGLTLTDCYNVLEKLRSGEALTAKERRVHEEGLVTVLLQLHDELDAAVAKAYGWPADLPDEEILMRLVDLNRECAQEEAQGIVRWLRPEYQNPVGPRRADNRQQELLPEAEQDKPAKPRKVAGKAKAQKVIKLTWPKTLPEQAKAVQSIMRENEDLSAADVAARFKRGKAEWVEPIMETLAALGQV